MQTSRFATYFELLYSDRMDIYRHDEVTNADKTKSMVLPDTPTVTNMPCRLSFKTIDAPEQIDKTGEPIKTVIKIFCRPNADVQAGDFAKVKRKDGNTVLGDYEGKIGNPAKYGTHMEALLIESDWA